MADLSIDFGELSASKKQIDDVISTFDRAERVSHDTATLVGHKGLSTKVIDFSDAWDIGRNKLNDNLRFISESLDAVIETFRDLDDEQAGKLKSVGRAGGEDSSPGAPTGIVAEDGMPAPSAPSDPGGAGNPGIPGGTGGPGGPGGPGGAGGPGGSAGSSEDFSPTLPPLPSLPPLPDGTSTPTSPEGSITQPLPSEMPDNAESAPQEIDRGEFGPISTLPGIAQPLPGEWLPRDEMPGVDLPGTEAPGTEAPSTEAPGADAPGTETPGTETPGTDTPPAETPDAATPAPGSTAPAPQAPSAGGSGGGSSLPPLDGGGIDPGISETDLPDLPAIDSDIPLDGVTLPTDPVAEPGVTPDAGEATPPPASDNSGATAGILGGSLAAGGLGAATAGIVSATKGTGTKKLFDTAATAAEKLTSERGTR